MRRALLLTALLSACQHAPAREEACGTAQVERFEFQRSSEGCEAGDQNACLAEAELLDRGGYFVPTDHALATRLRQGAGDAGLGDGALPPATEPPVAPTQRVPMDPSLVPWVESVANQSRFLPSSARVFDSLAETLIAHPEMTRIVLEGRATPDERDPEALALARAHAAVAQLVRRNIDRTRLFTEGFVLPGRRGVTFRQEE